ncbi:MAG: hypothetical protein KZQ76_09050 [Candidatus Thiodiazotropha sp. (ex Epidulcina cf. delphinae)]|nr:hypothetical protein [Candidatus Thiodiazotropha sp. (ex Epidulcina cf. delphinae)]
MDNIMNKISLIGVLSLIMVSISYAGSGPSWISRDCPGAGAKESITWDFWNPGYMYTQSHHVRKKNTPPYYEWEKHVSNSDNRLIYTRHSYAGQVGNWIKNYYYSGVYGLHWWYNLEARRMESNRKFVTNCNFTTNWGW